jgi:lysine 2,3-aminomutase
VHGSDPPTPIPPPQDPPGGDPLWWRAIPAWRHLDPARFGDPRWQLEHSVHGLDALLELVGPSLPPGFAADARAGMAAAPMALRLTPHALSLVDWSQPWEDPIRRQFLPLDSEGEPDHPMARLDALDEARDSVLPGLVHRYPGRVLYLSLDACPVYCRCCTRSYALGHSQRPARAAGGAGGLRHLDRVCDYLGQHPEVHDVVVSGGDTCLLPPRSLQRIGERLLALDSIRRIRFGSKLLAVLPQQIVCDGPWLAALTQLATLAHQRGCELALHTHVNHPRELTPLAAEAAGMLFERHITLRNQSVLQRGVNDDPATMLALLRGLSRLHARPYYVYTHDMVRGVEALRTTLASAIELEKRVRGAQAGVDTPTFVCDLMGGGGKRDLHSYERYDRQLGIAVYRSPALDPARPFLHLDPIALLDPAVQRAWREPGAGGRLVAQAIEAAGF